MGGKVKIGALAGLIEADHDQIVQIINVNDDYDSIFEGSIWDIPDELMQQYIYCWYCEKKYMVIMIDLPEGVEYYD